MAVYNQFIIFALLFFKVCPNQVKEKNMNNKTEFFKLLLVGVLISLFSAWLIVKFFNPALKAGYGWMEYVFVAAVLLSSSLLLLFLQARFFTIHGDAGDTASSRVKGVVKWYSGDKGYGFITNEYGEDVFVHYQSISDGNRVLAQGQTVEFVEKEEDKGLKAYEVSVIGR